ncbi:MAG: winged helix-turn-helix transcriptional regulator [Parachlamydiaceae bacterium]|nr:winged helix-turn-helix transcriptional regulator [Parachlamydiaceae bacterium]
MLDILCGSKNIEKILIFLFVNGKCYGTQLHRLLKTSLTPIQKALLRLEKGGIINSYFEGKTRVYQFNPACPLLNELEILLKKAYTLLSPQEKKQYCYIKEIRNSTQTIDQIDNKQVLLTFWKRLMVVTELTFHAKSKSKEESGWSGKGKGEVLIDRANEDIMIYQEKGNWKNEQGKETDFSNIFRWSLDRKAGMISLEHLRRGINNPVFLFHLAPTGNDTLTSIDSHLCDGDAYLGQVSFDNYSLRLNWRVIGPKKNEEIDYYYK